MYLVLTCVSVTCLCTMHLFLRPAKGMLSWWLPKRGMIHASRHDLYLSRSLAPQKLPNKPHLRALHSFTKIPALTDIMSLRVLLLAVLLFAPALAQKPPTGSPPAERPRRPRRRSPPSPAGQGLGGLSRDIIIAPGSENVTAEAPGAARPAAGEEALFPVCDNGLPQVRCLVDPCALTTCLVNTVCKSDYCGGCFGVCVDPATGLPVGEVGPGPANATNTTTATATANATAVNETVSVTNITTAGGGRSRGRGRTQTRAGEVCVATRQPCNCSSDCCGTSLCVSYNATGVPTTGGEAGEGGAGGASEGAEAELEGVPAGVLVANSSAPGEAAAVCLTPRVITSVQRRLNVSDTPMKGNPTAFNC